MKTNKREVAAFTIAILFLAALLLNGIIKPEVSEAVTYSIRLNNSPESIFCNDNGYIGADDGNCFRFEYLVNGKSYTPPGIVQYVQRYGRENITRVTIMQGYEKTEEGLVLTDIFSFVYTVA